MPLRLGDRNETVRQWRRVMAARFAGYARLRGELPTDTDEFGPRARAWQQEYEIRTQQVVDGEVSDADLIALGIPVPADHRPWLFTVQGTAVPDPMAPGFPADTARAVLDLYRWQPIGNYPAKAFPMWGSIMMGVDELLLQIEAKLTADPVCEFALAGYSQGAMVVAYVLKHHIISPQSRLHRFLPRLKKVVFWGNPMRQRGIAHSDEWIYEVAPPNSQGIFTQDLLEGLERHDFEVRDYAHKKDMYACNEDDDTDEYKRAVAKIVMKATDWFRGPDSVVSQLMELRERPIREGIALATSIIEALQFAAGIAAHSYNIHPAIRFLREV